MHIGALATITEMENCNTHNRTKIQKARYATHMWSLEVLREIAGITAKQMVTRSTTKDGRRHCNT